jgi:hypothetical protein
MTTRSIGRSEFIHVGLPISVASCIQTRAHNETASHDSAVFNALGVRIHMLRRHPFKTSATAPAETTDDSAE